MRKGFSLVEMIVAVGVLFAIVGLTVPAFMRNNRTQKVVAMRDKLKLTYIQARDNALSGKNECGNLSFQGWRVVVSGGTSVIEGICSSYANPYPSVNSTFSSHTENIPTGLTVSFLNLSNLGNGVLFRPGGQGIFPSLTAANNVITVTITDAFGNSKNFTINGFGNIQ